MAENKKSIIVYADWIDKFEELEDDEAGRLIKHFFRYVNDLNPEFPDRITKISFIDIEKSLKRDLKKWETTIEGRSKAGKASAEARRLAKENEQTSTNSTNVDSVQQNSTNPTDSVNVNDSVSVTVNVNEKNIINNTIFSNECLTAGQWIDVVSKSVKIKIESIPFFLSNFNDHLITKGEQKKTTKEYKDHFANWIKKQDLSSFASSNNKGKTNQI